MMLRRFFFAITSGSLLAIACGGSADSTGNSSQSDSACSVVATSYDQSCTTDADCVLVPPGGNTCDPCGDPSGSGMYYFFCDEVAINVKDRARYLAALQSGLATVPDNQLSCSSSCPMAPAATCVKGACTPGQALGTP